ncbi:hypothetical protein STEG23_016552, partial [Scotinomys teguina]
MLGRGRLRMSRQLTPPQPDTEEARYKRYRVSVLCFTLLLVKSSAALNSVCASSILLASGQEPGNIWYRDHQQQQRITQENVRVRCGTDPSQSAVRDPQAGSAVSEDQLSITTAHTLG